jgi:V/A-type H+/Na+-transporting ATPase subunit I
VILPMVQVELFGSRKLLPETLTFLQAEGVLQLRLPAAAGANGPPLADPIRLGVGDEALEAMLEETVRRVDALRARLPAPTGPGRVAATLPPPGTPELSEALNGLEARLGAVETRRAALLDESERVSIFSRLVVALAPLGHDLDPGLEPELHGLVLKRDPVALGLLVAEVRRITGGRCEITSRELDDEQLGVLLAVPKANGRELTALLFARGVDEMRLPAALAGRSLVEGLLAVASRQRELPAEIAEADEALASLAREGPALTEARCAAQAALERLRASGRCGATRFAFVVAGWMPEERLAPLAAAAAARFGDQVAVLGRRPPPASWSEVPVVLRNHPWSRPFEPLLGLVSLPRYGSIDPTPLLAIGFPLFFGLVLGDLVFGVLAAAVALLARARGWGGRRGRDITVVVLACAVASAVFGLLFGEALGGVGARFGLHPLLFERRTSLMTFLALTTALGLVHLLLGGGLGVASALRAGHRRDAVARLGKLVLLGGGAVAAVAWLGPLPPWALPPALAVAGAGLLVALLAEGPVAALDVVLGLGNVLSYSRLMALGLASATLADVANGLATAIQPPTGLALAILLHAVNFTLCLVSPVVAALRLHYVEFFERFYDEGGAPYRPFAVPSS